METLHDLFRQRVEEGIRNLEAVPFAKPLGRSPSSFFGRALSSATGTFRRQILTTSPASTLARYSESLALTSNTFTSIMTI